MEMYNGPQIETMLDSMCILVDTREQETEAFKKRVEGFGYPFARKKLNYGDYSAEYTTPDGEKASLEKIVAIERKMNIDELCQCFTSGRERFKREFERAKEDGCKIYLLVEQANYRKIKSGRYRSKLPPQSLNASIETWSARYNTQIRFYDPELTSWGISQILHYELREYLLNQ